MKPYLILFLCCRFDTVLGSKLGFSSSHRKHSYPRNYLCICPTLLPETGSLNLELITGWTSGPAPGSFLFLPPQRCNRRHEPLCTAFIRGCREFKPRFQWLHSKHFTDNGPSLSPRLFIINAPVAWTKRCQFYLNHIEIAKGCILGTYQRSSTFFKHLFTCGGGYVCVTNSDGSQKKIYVIQFSPPTMWV